MKKPCLLFICLFTMTALAGTYTLGDGEITLAFNGGPVAKHSFFYSPPNEEDLILLDGEFYFREEDKGSQDAPSPLPTPADLMNRSHPQQDSR